MFNYHNIIGPTAFDDSNINFDMPLYIEGSKDYMPLICLMGDVINHHVPMEYSIDVYGIESGKKTRTINFVKHLSEYAKGLDKIFNPPSSGSVYRRERVDRDMILKGMKNLTKKYLNGSVNCNLSFDIAKYERTSYDRISAQFFRNSFSTYYLQSMKTLVSGYGSIYRGYDRGLMMSIVVRNDLIKYQKYHLIVNGDFDYKNMEFWINCDIDTPFYPYKAFRKMYRNSIKPKIIASGMPIIQKGDVDRSLKASFEVPQTSIAELEEWKTNLLSTFLEKEAGEITFQF